MSKTESAVTVCYLFIRPTWALWAYGPYGALYKLTFYLLTCLHGCQHSLGIIGNVWKQITTLYIGLSVSNCADGSSSMQHVHCNGKNMDALASLAMGMCPLDVR